MTIVKLKTGEEIKFAENRADCVVEYVEGFVVVTDEYGERKHAYPTADVVKVEYGTGRRHGW